MLDIPGLTEDELRSHIIGMHLGMTLYPLWFIEERLGAKGVEAYYDWLAKQCAETLETTGVASPMKLVMMNAITERNLMGSKVSVEGDDDRAVLTVHRCRRLHHAKQWAQYGSGKERALTRERYCATCLETGLRRLAEEVCLAFETALLEEGCQQVLSGPARAPSQPQPMGGDAGATVVADEVEKNNARAQAGKEKEEAEGEAEGEEDARYGG